jgi:hypothetical protein
MDLKSPGMMDHPLYARPVPPKRRRKEESKAMGKSAD